MLLPLIFIGWTLTLSNCAPAQLLYTTPIVRSVIQPIVAAPNPIFLYEPAVNYQLLRQNPPGINNTQISEIIGIFQDAGAQAQGTFQQLQEWGQSWGQSWGQGFGTNNERLPASTMELKPMLNERFDKQPSENMEMLNKNENMKLKISSDNEQKQYYTFSPGYPQIYYNLVQPAYRPILSLQSVQAIRARSMADLNPIKNDKFLSQIASSGVVAESDSNNVPAGTVALVEPLKTFGESVKDEQLVENQPEQNVVKVEQEQEQEQVPKSFAKFIQDNQADPAISSRSQSDEPNKSNDITTVVKDAEGGSIAKASPVGAAVAGKAGHAESAPVATAIVGKDGLAIAQPIASAVAGEFGGNFEKKDIEEKPAAEPIKVE